MQVETVVVGPIQTNCYLVSDADELIVIDPGDDLGRIMGALSGRTPKLIVCTHYHWDHMSAVAGLQAKTGAPFAISAVDVPKIQGKTQMNGHDIVRGYDPASIDVLLGEGDEVAVGGAVFTVIETPGHTPGSICLHCPDQGVLIAGDTLFAGGRYGRTDFEDGSPADMRNSLKRKFASVPDDTRVLCGHEAPSVMGTERKLNPYLGAYHGAAN